jgi:hypothetical protein
MLQLVKKKLKSGTPTGDILDAVIAEEMMERSAESQSALPGCRAWLEFPTERPPIATCQISKCATIAKWRALGGAKLMKCQRCKVTYYCRKVPSCRLEKPQENV